MTCRFGRFLWFLFLLFVLSVFLGLQGLADTAMCKFKEYAEILILANNN